MAFKTIAQTDTLETFRTTFNALSTQDFGDIANLSGAISATNLVDAMNETISIATSTAGWTIADDTSTTQIIGGGNTLTVLGTANQIQTVVSPIDTLTLSFPNDVTIPNDLIVTNTITALGSTQTLGSIQITGNTISSTSSGTITINDLLRVKGVSSENSSFVLVENAVGDGTYVTNISSTRADRVLQFPAIPIFRDRIAFEGLTDDAFETIIEATDPTADRTITIPDITGTLVTTGDTGSITSTMILNGTISTDDIADDQISEAKIADDAVGQDQLKSVVNLQILNSSGGFLKSIYGAGA